VQGHASSLRDWIARGYFTPLEVLAFCGEKSEHTSVLKSGKYHKEPGLGRKLQMQKSSEIDKNTSLLESLLELEDEMCNGYELSL
jgi:hypothetical protein